MKIKTICECPPIPIRCFDWSAIDEDSYSGDPSEPVGRGETEEAAITDLLEQIREGEE